MVPLFDVFRRCDALSWGREVSETTRCRQTPFRPFPLTRSAQENMGNSFHLLSFTSNLVLENPRGKQSSPIFSQSGSTWNLLNIFEGQTTVIQALSGARSPTNTWFMCCCMFSVVIWIIWMYWISDIPRVHQKYSEDIGHHRESSNSMFPPPFPVRPDYLIRFPILGGTLPTIAWELA